jgi:predicted enzyme related to lactoylglutathione lyase
MDTRLEVIVVPVGDVDRAKQFYLSLSWRLDADVVGDDDFRVVQVTAPGSPCSIIFGKGVAEPGAGPVTGLHLAVTDIDSVRRQLQAAGVEVSETFHDVATRRSPHSQIPTAIAGGCRN